MSAFHKIMNTLLVFPFCCMFVIVPLQWGYNASSDKDWVITYPLNFREAAIPLVSKVGSSANDITIGLMSNKNNMEIHQSEAVQLKLGIYWIAIGK